MEVKAPLRWGTLSSVVRSHPLVIRRTWSRNVSAQLSLVLNVCAGVICEPFPWQHCHFPTACHVHVTQYVICRFLIHIITFELVTE